MIKHISNTKPSAPKITDCLCSVSPKEHNLQQTSGCTARIILLTMGQALYRKYRSKSLDEVVGQEHVTTTLKNALKQGRISHAYLLSGPRGVGKTSIARILA